MKTRSDDVLAIEPHVRKIDSGGQTEAGRAAVLTRPDRSILETRVACYLVKHSAGRGNP
jgi:hypothetical protein